MFSMKDTDIFISAASSKDSSCHSTTTRNTYISEKAFKIVQWKDFSCIYTSLDMT